MQGECKICNKCGDSKLLSDFYDVKTAKDGKHGTCKACLLETQRQWRLANQEQSREKARRYALAHRQEAAARTKAWYAKNRERARVYAKSYY